MYKAKKVTIKKVKENRVSYKNMVKKKGLYKG
jgi:hypothetical protein